MNQFSRLVSTIMRRSAHGLLIGATAASTLFAGCTRDPVVSDPRGRYVLERVDGSQLPYLYKEDTYSYVDDTLHVWRVRAEFYLTTGTLKVGPSRYELQGDKRIVVVEAPLAGREIRSPAEGLDAGGFDVTGTGVLFKSDNVIEVILESGRRRGDKLLVTGELRRASGWEPATFEFRAVSASPF